VYYTNYNTSYEFPSSDLKDSYSVPINLSAGKIKYLCIKPIAKAQNCYESASWEQFGSSYSKYLDLPFKIKIRLGNDVLSTYDVSTIPEMYEQTIKTLNNQSFSSCEDVDVERCINKKAPCCVSGTGYAKYTVTGDKLIDGGGLIMAFDFERLQALGVSGLSTNQERLLSVEISDLRTDQGGDIGIESFYFSIQYLVVANLFSDGQIAINK
jgi:hypothetical protein